MRKPHKALSRLSAAAVALVLTATACSSLNQGSGDQEFSGQTLTVAGTWDGGEGKAFRKVLDGFTAKTGAKVKFESSRATGVDDFAAFIRDKIKSKKAPDVAMVPQVGVLQQFAQKGWLEPLPPSVELEAARNFALVWQNYGSYRRVFYGLYFKASHKSTVWYNPKAFDKAEVLPPTDYDEMLRVGKKLSAAGYPAFSVAGKDAWPLTDWFENIYLAQAGPTNYAKLATNEIGWTDPTVVKALKTLGKLTNDQDLTAGGGTEALRTDLAESVEAVFGKKPKAAMVYEGDFVAGLIAGEAKKDVDKVANFFPFPKVDDGEAPVLSGGDAAVAMKDSKNKDLAMSFIEYLASPKAASIWAKEGGFLSPNINLDLDAYPNETTRKVAKSLVDAGEAVQFDMSDQAPGPFGGTPGQGEWQLLQDFVRDPSNPEATARKLDAAAAKAYLDASATGTG
ncbi:alpha-glucoside transport system substrate-binding protein [Streptomyces sp. WMMB 714]|jgi:alpha-glucoside transport system substrate-binding protein|uniref:ABC transporter substrate-binding protein n=1 Tax=Streptomyces sp. WMMB 714 TaxID=1286822 RepID=UPI0005F7FF90|nr:ABC transporter substrate-binding protein [Streptomyces sp. WMMB 714]SCK26940.1 alpha-glucoside transport system substrate-binding protein [Streptomyces sp. WMMB 714]